MFGEIMSFTKISSKGQIVLPKEVRESLKLRPGELVEVRVEKNVAVIVPIRKPSESMRGIGRRVRERLKLSAVALVRELREE
jgi:AbrB family looped-hinge helix DNA binding protein